MAEKVIKIKSLAKYNGHSIKPNSAVELKLKFSYEELVNYYMRLPLLRSENTDVIVRIGDEEPLKLGNYMFNRFSMDHDGEGVIQFNSQLDAVEADNLNKLAANKDNMFRVMFKASIETDEEEDEE